MSDSERVEFSDDEDERPAEVVTKRSGPVNDGENPAKRQRKGGFGALARREPPFTSVTERGRAPNVMSMDTIFFDGLVHLTEGDEVEIQMDTRRDPKSPNQPRKDAYHPIHIKRDGKRYWAIECFRGEASHCVYNPNIQRHQLRIKLAEDNVTPEQVEKYQGAHDKRPPNDSFVMQCVSKSLFVDRLAPFGKRHPALRKEIEAATKADPNLKLMPVGGREVRHLVNQAFGNTNDPSAPDDEIEWRRKVFCTSVDFPWEEMELNGDKRVFETFTPTADRPGSFRLMLDLPDSKFDDDGKRQWRSGPPGTPLAKPGEERHLLTYKVTADGEMVQVTAAEFEKFFPMPDPGLSSEEARKIRAGPKRVALFREVECMYHGTKLCPKLRYRPFKLVFEEPSETGGAANAVDLI